MMRKRSLGGAFLLSGALAIAGALLPWLTLYAGLYQYAGTVGLNGRIVLAAGIAMIGAGLITLRAGTARIAWAGLLFALMLLAFSAWLYAGMIEIINRPDSVMLVVRAGPGLFFVIASGVLLTIASLVSVARANILGSMQRRQKISPPRAV